MKERIIGAVILVLFVVLVVPIFLDGPTNDGEIISEHVPLPGQTGDENRTIVLDRDRTEPVPAANLGNPPAEQRSATQPAVKQIEEPQPAKVEPAQPKPAPAQAKPEAKPEASTATTIATTSTTGMWAVQMGSFGNQQNAEKLAADLRKQGFAAFLSELTTSEGKLHRVRIGPQKDRESADAMAVRLQKAGHKGQVVPHP